MGPRAKGGKRCNVYHGNFAPQIPDQMIRRYTEEGDTILELFMGSGTTLFECETLKRNYIGFDINQKIIDFVKDKMIDCTDVNYFIHNCDVTNKELFVTFVRSDLELLNRKTIDHIIIHPPYLDIVKFTDDTRDLSNISDLSHFIYKFKEAVMNAANFLKSGKYISLIIGDIYRDGEVIPLGFYLMQAVQQVVNCKLKGIVVKDMVGNRAKLGIENLWRYRALKSDNFLFKHEYLFVFKKISK